MAEFLLVVLKWSFTGLVVVKVLEAIAVFCLDTIKWSRGILVLDIIGDIFIMLALAAFTGTFVWVVLN